MAQWLQFRSHVASTKIDQTPNLNCIYHPVESTRGIIGGNRKAWLGSKLLFSEGRLSWEGAFQRKSHGQYFNNFYAFISGPYYIIDDSFLVTEAELSAEH